MRFPVTAASLNAMETNRPPAIVQQAQKTCAWYRQQYEENEKKHWAVQDALLANFKESGIWKSEFNTWGAACELLLGISQGRANERILRHKQSALAQTTSPHADRANPQDKKEQKALSQVEKAREATPEPEKEEDEKPAVHSADEAKPEPAKPHTNGHQPKQNGKPKTQLPIWKEIEDDLIGKAYRRVDDLNRVCPNPVHHKRLISALKMAHGILDEWRRDTK